MGRAAVIAIVVAACSSAPPRSEPVTDDLDTGQPVRGDGPAERSRPLPPDSPRHRAARRPVRRSRGYRGRRVDLDLKDADLHNVFRLLADVGNVNVVVGDGVAGEVTLRVRDLPWDQVLATIVRTKGLYMKVEGNVIMITASDPEDR